MLPYQSLHQLVLLATTQLAARQEKGRRGVSEKATKAALQKLRCEAVCRMGDVSSAGALCCESTCGSHGRCRFFGLSSSPSSTLPSALLSFSRFTPATARLPLPPFSLLLPLLPPLLLTDSGESLDKANEDDEGEGEEEGEEDGDCICSCNDEGSVG